MRTEPRFVDMVTIEGESCPRRTVKTIAAADEVLRMIALDAPSNGGYDKTWFKITLCNGDKYEGRIDIKYINCPQETESGQLGILEHIRTKARFYCGLHCPSHMTEEHYQHLRTIKPEWEDQYRQWSAWLGIDLTTNNT